MANGFVPFYMDNHVDFDTESTQVLLFGTAMSLKLYQCMLQDIVDVGLTQTPMSIEM